ncbi:YidC/Oxa1 family membrane protein insertase [Candidatus Allofournierella merdipullorum]|uniref:YidC/Oxa1 family membrane protein insertase n=1 Tax=Candidatus Allofournierella merdipullorum TaxID=2838595 RepID=UPI003AB73C44
MGFLGFLGTPLGYVLQWMYDLFGSYGWALIVFTVAVRLLSFPLQIGQQKNTARMAAYRPMIEEIQKKYAKDREKQNEELMRLQQEYGYNPTAGCLPMFVNFFIMFGVIEAVYYPLQHILHISKDVLTQIAGILDMTYTYTTNTAIIQMVQKGTLPAEASALLTPEQLENIKNFNVMFMGMDLTVKPELAFNILLLFPVLSVVTMALSNIIMMKSSGQELQGSMKWMPWMMSLMFVWIAFTVPVAFSLYYTVSNVLMLITSMITRKMYDPEKMKAQVAAEIEEKKKAKKAKKQVKVVDEKTGEEKLKEVTEAEMNRLRIERARAIDAELYKDERTTPLNAKTGEEESCEK